MSSSYGKRHGLSGYDEFKTGLTYRDVWEMLRDDDCDSSKWRYKRRHTVLGMWHSLKLEMYARYINEITREVPHNG